MNDLPQEMIPRDLSEAKVAIAELRLICRNQETKLGEDDLAIAGLRADLKEAKEAIDDATKDFATFKAQLSGGWKVLVVLGGITMAISYFVYNLKNIFGVK